MTKVKIAKKLSHYRIDEGVLYALKKTVQKKNKNLKPGTNKTSATELVESGIESVCKKVLGAEGYKAAIKEYVAANS